MASTLTWFLENLLQLDRASTCRRRHSCCRRSRRNPGRRWTGRHSLRRHFAVNVFACDARDVQPRRSPSTSSLSRTSGRTDRASSHLLWVTPIRHSERWIWHSGYSRRSIRGCAIAAWSASRCQFWRHAVCSTVTSSTGPGRPGAPAHPVPSCVTSKPGRRAKTNKHSLRFRTEITKKSDSLSALSLSLFRQRLKSAL